MGSDRQAGQGWWVAACAILFGFAYLPALDNGFVSDDWFFLAEARKLVESGDFGRVFSFRSDWFFRPVQFLVTALLYQATGLETWGYRLVVIALHAANAVLLGRLAYRLLQRASPALPARELAWLTAIFFVFFAARPRSGLLVRGGQRADLDAVPAGRPAAAARSAGAPRPARLARRRRSGARLRRGARRPRSRRSPSAPKLAWFSFMYWRPRVGEGGRSPPAAR